MGSLARPQNLFRLVIVGLMILCLHGVPSALAKQKRPPPRPANPFIPTPSSTSKSSLTGEKVTLTWDDFNRRESSPEGQRKSSDIHSLAYTLASYQIGTSLQWTQATARAPKIWRLSTVNAEVKLRTDRSWVLGSLFPTEKDSLAEKANKEAVLARLLQHEQGHYDIVALIARDLYHDLLALQEFKSDVELQRKVDELRSSADNQIEALNRKYDEQCGNIGRDRNNQARWNKLLDQAKEGKRLTSLFADPPK